MKIKTDLSPNFSSKTRLKRSIKFIIIHYTGMQSEIESINRLKNIKAKVSCHYLINRKGLIIQMVKDNKIAWHAGKSKWGNDKNLNLNSIGIELVNKGDEKFPFLQIKNLCMLIKYIKKKHKIQKKHVLGHSHIAPGRKIDPGIHFPWKKLANQNLSNNH